MNRYLFGVLMFSTQSLVFSGKGKNAVHATVPVSYATTTQIHYCQCVLFALTTEIILVRGENIGFNDHY
jgi:hypothetical protein